MLRRDNGEDEKVRGSAQILNKLGLVNRLNWWLW